MPIIQDAWFRNLTGFLSTKVVTLFLPKCNLSLFSKEEAVIFLMGEVLL